MKERKGDVEGNRVFFDCVVFCNMGKLWYYST